MSKKKKIVPIPSKKKKNVAASEETWEHISALLEQIRQERKLIVGAFNQAKRDYIEQGGSSFYFPVYLKETYGINLSTDEDAMVLFPTYTIVDSAKYEFFALRYL